MPWGACTPRIRWPSCGMLLAGVLLLLDCPVECQLASTVVVHDSAELASALRNASDASRTTPADTVIYLNLLSSEVRTMSRFRRYVCKAHQKVEYYQARRIALQAAQNADFFVINRQDFLTSAAINIWPGQKVTIASGETSQLVTVPIRGQNS